jgi:hypothetical protein
MKDPFIRVKFTKEQSFARQLAKEYFEKYPKDRYQTLLLFVLAGLAPVLPLMTETDSELQSLLPQ